MPMLRRVPTWIAVIGLAVVYIASARLGLSMAFVASQVTAVWPPTGIALAAVVLLGRGVVPAIFVGALIANLWTGAPLAVSAGIATGNTLEALSAGWILRRVGFSPSLASLRDVLWLVTVGALASTV